MILADINILILILTLVIVYVIYKLFNIQLVNFN